MFRLRPDAPATDGVEWVIATTDAAQADEVIRAAAGVAVCIWRGPPTTLGWREGM